MCLNKIKKLIKIRQPLRSSYLELSCWDCLIDEMF